MSSSIIASEMEESSLGMQSYSQKEKSLGVLIFNFLRLYNRDDVDLIGLDDAAGKLGVERRRIFDVVNILESIGVVARKGKNQYSWKGFEEVPRTLNELKEEGMKEWFDISNNNNSEKVSNDDDREEFFSLTPDDLENSASSKLGSTWSKHTRVGGAAWVLRDYIVDIDHSRRRFVNLRDTEEARFNSIIWAAESMRSLHVNNIVSASQNHHLNNAILRPKAWRSFWSQVNTLFSAIDGVPNWSNDEKAPNANRRTNLIAINATKPCF